jgi:RimJ/RimL family protein N-acetyltransferase
MIPLSTLIDTPRCILRMQAEEDAPCMVEALAAPGFIDGLLYTHPLSMEEALQDIAHKRERWEKGNAYHFSIVRRDTDAPVGRIGIARFPERGWMLNYWVHPAHQRQGFAQEAIKGMLRFAVSHLDLQQVLADAYSWNVWSQKALLNCGFTHQGTADGKEQYRILT